MARFIKSRKQTHGASPGSLIFIGNKKMEKAELQLMVYDWGMLRRNGLKTEDSAEFSGMKWHGLIFMVCANLKALRSRKRFTIHAGAGGYYEHRSAPKW